MWRRSEQQPNCNDESTCSEYQLNAVKSVKVFFYLDFRAVNDHWTFGLFILLIVDQ